MIIFHAAGSSKLGIGNISRSTSLAFELVELGVKNIFMVFEASPDIVNKFKIKGVDYLIAKDRSDAISKRFVLVQCFREDRKILITDLLNLNQQDSDYARKQGFDYLVHMTHSGMPGYQPDLFVDGEVFVEDWNLDESVTLLQGQQYQIVRPEIKKYRPKGPWCKDKVNSVFICFGGSDPAKYSEAFLAYFVDNLMFEKDVNFTLAVGPAVSEVRWNNISTHNFPHLTILRSPENIGETISRHDVVVTLGGLIIYEALCLGKPVFAIEWDYIAYFVRRLNDSGVIKSISANNNIFDNIFFLMKQTKVLISIASKGWNFVDGMGGMRVAKYIQAGILSV